MNENNGRLVFLWSGADSRSTLGANSQWFPHLVLTPSKAQVLTPRSYILFFRYFNFVLVVLRQFWYQSKHRSVEVSLQERIRKIKQKKKKNPLLSLFSTHQTPLHHTTVTHISNQTQNLPNSQTHRESPIPPPSSHITTITINNLATPRPNPLQPQRQRRSPVATDPDCQFLPFLATEKKPCCH